MNRNHKITVTTFARTGRTTLLDALLARTTLPLTVVPVGNRAVVTDATHLKFNATFASEAQARQQAVLAMARRTR